MAATASHNPIKLAMARARLSATTRRKAGLNSSAQARARATIMAAGFYANRPGRPMPKRAPGLWHWAISLYSAAFRSEHSEAFPMKSAATDVVGIGNAIVDVIAHADEPFLAAQGFAKGAMT